MIPHLQNPFLPECSAWECCPYGYRFSDNHSSLLQSQNRTLRSPLYFRQTPLCAALHRAVSVPAALPDDPISRILILKNTKLTPANMFFFRAHITDSLFHILPDKLRRRINIPLVRVPVHLSIILSHMHKSSEYRKDLFSLLFLFSFVFSPFLSHCTGV